MNETTMMTTDKRHNVNVVKTGHIRTKTNIVEAVMVLLLLLVLLRLLHYLLLGLRLLSISAVGFDPRLLRRVILVHVNSIRV